ncbi:PAS domain S-box protein [Kamptonema formosum]
MRVYRRCWPYGVAIGSTASALLVALWLKPLLSPIVSPLFYIAIIFSAWYGGFRPGMVAAVLSTLTISYFFIAPRNQFWVERPEGLLQLGLFLLVALTIDLLTDNFHESKKKVERLSRQLAQENAEQLRMALEGAQMGMWDWNLVTGEVKWSPEHALLLGLDPDAFEGKYQTFDTCVHPEDRQGLERALQEALQTRSIYQHEYRVIWPDGSTHWIEARGRGFYEETGQPVRMTGTIMDIDGRKQAETLLHQQFERQRLVMEIAQRIRQSLNLEELLQTTVDQVRQFMQCDRVIIFQFAPDWSGTVVVESVGSEWTAILSTQIYDPCFGKNYIEPFKQGLFTAKSDIYTAGIDNCHIELLATFQVRANLVVGISKGEKLWGLLIAHHCASPREWQPAEIELMRQLATQAGIAIQQADLFERVQTELRERKLVEAALRESEIQLQRQLAEIETIYQSAPIGLNVLDTDLRFVRINQRLAEINGFSVGAHIGRTVRELLPEMAGTTENILHSILETGQPLLNVEITGETPAQPGVQRTWVESFLPLKDGERIIGISTVCEEITERKQAQLTLQQLNAELEERVAQRTAELTEVNDRLLVALLEKEHAYQLLKEQAQLLELAHDSIITCDLNSAISFWNQGAESMYGWSKAEAFGQDLHAFLKTQFPKPPGEILAELLEKGYWEGELVHFTRDNRPVTVASRWVLQKDDAGRPIKVLEINNDISERKQAEKALKLSEEKYRRIVHTASEGIWVIDAEGKTNFVNPRMVEMLGYSAEEMMGESLFAFMDEAWEAIAAAKLQSRRQGITEQHDFKFRCKDGSDLWCIICTSPILDEAGQFLGALGMVADITARKRAEKALQQQAKQEQLLFSITQAIRQSLDLNATLNTAVTEVRQTLQVERAAVYRFNVDWSGDFVVESVTPDWVKLVTPDVKKVWEDTYLQETGGGRFQNRETFVVADIYTAGLQPCHVELLQQFQAKAYAVAPIFSGEALWGLLAIYQNTASRHWQSWEIELLEQIASQLAIAIQQSEIYGQLQLELHQREQTEAILRESERRWRFLLDNVQLLVVGLDPAGAVNYVNPFFLKLTGYAESEVLGQNWFETFLPVSHRQQLQRIFSEILASNAHPYYHNLILTKWREERFIAWNNTLLRDSAGRIIGTVSIGEDITERHKIEEMKNEFIGIVSHELRTPLTAIRASLGLLKTGIYDKKPDKFKRMIEIALTDSERLVRLVNDILDLERLESGRAILEKTACKAADLIQQAVEGVRAIADRQHITLSVHPTDVEVWAAPDAIVQTLTNLLSNALKFSPPDTAITISAERQADRALFQVRDLGRGIPADKLEAIFGRFQQVDASDSRDKGGTGLGLAICRSIIEQHGGRIWAESTIGAGSTFFFTLPLPVDRAND